MNLGNSSIAAGAGFLTGGLVSAVPTSGAPLLEQSTRFVLGGASTATTAPFLIGPDTSAQDLGVAFTVGGLGSTVDDYAAVGLSAAAAAPAVVEGLCESNERGC